VGCLIETDAHVFTQFESERLATKMDKNRRTIPRVENGKRLPVPPTTSSIPVVEVLYNSLVWILGLTDDSRMLGPLTHLRAA
jgi:hypothetical protein